MRNSPAYTLVEILVGITIIGLIFGFGFVSFREFSRRQALTGAAKQIQGDLRLTQELAIAGQKPEDIDCDSPNTLTGYNFRVNPDSSYTIEAACTGNGGTNVELKEVSLPSDISLSATSPNPILFKALGQGTNMTQGSSVTLTLVQAGTGSQIIVTISASGEIK